MELLGLSVNGLIILLTIIYVLYLNNILSNKQQLPVLVKTLFNNVIVRVLFILLIVYLINVKSKSKIGGFTVGASLAIMYMLTFLATSNTYEYLTVNDSKKDSKKDEVIKQIKKVNNDDKNKKDKKDEKDEIDEKDKKKPKEGFSNNGGDTPVGKAYSEKEQVSGCEMTTQYADAETAFNPDPHRPDEDVMGTGGYDKIPPIGSGDDFHSDPSGPYTTSGTAYGFDMS